jgi:LmbE family N-acetylglucosaminyl deacetylase
MAARLGSVAAVVLTLLLLASDATQAVQEVAKAPLFARSDASNASNTTAGLTYKILQLADLHVSGVSSTKCDAVPSGMAASDCTEALTIAFVEKLLDVEQPDFVAFSGDNVHTFGPSDHQKAVDDVTAAVEARGIPYAMVFGNHEEEGDFPREKIVQLLANKPHSYTERGPDDVDGIGNYMLKVNAPVDGPWGSQGDDVLRMYFLDSGAEADTSKYPYVFSEYDWIKQSQIDLYRELSGSDRTSLLMPAALMFFHIPLVEFTYRDDAGACRGEHREWVHRQGMNMKLLQTVVDSGDIKAIFVGHDHLNEYCCRVNGVQLCYGGGTGFGRAYGASDFTRRARVIEWTVDSDNKRKIRSWSRHWDDMSVKHSEEVLYSEQ